MLSILLYGILVSAVISCADDKIEPTIPTGLQNDLETETTLDIVYEEADLITDLAVAAEVDAHQGGRISTTSDDALHCATRTHNTDTKTITVDFGDGCTDPKGRIRKGKLIINYTAPRYKPGSIVTTSFDNFSIDDIKVEGSRVVENISTSIEDNPSFKINLTGGKVSWTDGTFATRTVTDKIKVWLRTENPANDELHFTQGKVEGKNRDGKTYTKTILEKVIYKKACTAEDIYLPAQGAIQIERAEKPTLSIDYGSGDCDKLVAVTVEGKTFEIEVKK